MKNTENLKYIAFYLLLFATVILGASGKFSWAIIFPCALILAGAFIAVKGKDWRKLIGDNEMNAVVVFVATYISQLVLSAIGFGIVRLFNMLIN